MADPLVIQIADRCVAVRHGEQCESHPLECASTAVAPADLAQAIRQLAEPSLPCHATLVIPSSWCYVHRVSVPGRRPERSGLAFAFEEFVPVDVETLTCDFLRAGDGTHLAVGIETERMQPLLDALRGAGLDVERITLDVIDAAAGSNADRLLWCDDEHVALLTRSAGHIESLRCGRLASSLDDAGWVERVQERVRAIEGPVAALDGTASPTRLAELRKSESIVPADDTPQPRQSELIEFNLARDALAPPSRRIDLLLAWRRTVAAGLAALLVLTVGLAVQRAWFEERIATVEHWERQLFMQLFPEQAVPAGVAMRLASERKRLEGLTLSAGNQIPEQTDALAVMHHIVSNLPEDLRLDLQELRIENGNVTLRGRTRDHRAAEQMAAAINKGGSFQCGSPQTERQADGGVLFYLHAQHVADAPARLASRDGRQ